MAGKLPKMIYVVERREEPDNAILIAESEPDRFEDGEIVGVYELKSTKRARIVCSLEAMR
jgi:hypothetical protein